MKHSFDVTVWKILFVIAILPVSIRVFAQNSSYNANTIPIGGTNSTAFGTGTLAINTGSFNAAYGVSSLHTNVGGSYNTAHGYQSLYTNNSGNNNTASGYQSLYFNLTGTDNLAAGFQSLYYNTTGNANTANGSQSLYYNTTGTNNIASGFQALYYNTVGDGNIAIGSESQYFSLAGNYNISLGANSLSFINTGNNNIATGTGALLSCSTGNNNIATGTDALWSEISADKNIAIGDSAGYNSTGNKNLYLGNLAGFYETTGSNKFYLANDSNQTILYGDFTTGQLLMGNHQPTGYAFKGTRTLNVVGGILADSMRVSHVSGWSDYVFSNEYKLRPLQELASYIDKNKHLPDIPSASEVENNGIELGNMNAKLLEKIEELHLYILQQEKKLDEQQKLLVQQSWINESLQKQIDNLKQASVNIK